MTKKTRRIFLSLGAIAALAVGGCFALSHVPLGQLTREQGRQIRTALKEEGKELPVGAAFRVQMDPNDLSITEGLDEAWRHFLLLGTDTGDITLNTGRTDAMMVLSLNVETGDLKLTSLVRDMLVKISGAKLK